MSLKPVEKLQSVLGTTPYMAPEFEDIEYGYQDCYDGRKIDVFALGMTLLRLAFNIETLYTSAQKDNIYQHIMTENYPEFWRAMDLEA